MVWVDEIRVFGVLLRGDCFGGVSLAAGWSDLGGDRKWVGGVWVFFVSSF